MPRASIVAACALAALCAAAAASAALEIVAGPLDGPHAVLTFAPASGPAGLRIETRAAGVTGSRLVIRVDRSPIDAFDHLFDAGECSFPEGGTSVCLVAVPASDPAYATIVESFRLGLEARVSVQDAGVMRMDHAVSLAGFSRGLGL
jgi:hypothetical protein